FHVVFTTWAFSECYIKCDGRSRRIARLPSGAAAARAMTEHTKTAVLPGLDPSALPQVLERSRPRNERMASDKIECNACPVLCQISAGKTGACDRYANQAGVLVRVDPVVLLRRTVASEDAPLVPFAPPGSGEVPADPAWT